MDDPSTEQASAEGSTEDEVLIDLIRYLNGAAITHALAVGGLSRIRSEMASAPPPPKGIDPDFMVGGDPNDPDATFYARLTVSQTAEILAEGGTGVEVLGRQWLIDVFAAWEHTFRPRLAKARSTATDQAIVPEFGDLRLMRNDILHVGATATREQTGRCEVFDWFEVGDRLVITGDHIQEFMRNMGLEGLVNPPRHEDSGVEGSAVT